MRTTVIERETKSWTWVNERPCEKCGFDASSTAASEIPAIRIANRAEWRRGLTDRPTATLTARPDPETWSPLEHACHVRDVLDLRAYRFERVLAEGHPVFEDRHPNDRAAARRHDLEEDPAVVFAGLIGQSNRVVAIARAMSDEGWARRGRRADELEFTNARLAANLAHDAVHHLHDVELILGR